MIVDLCEGAEHRNIYGNIELFTAKSTILGKYCGALHLWKREK